MSTPHDYSYSKTPKEDLPFRETLVEEAQLSECDRVDLNFLGSIQGDTANVVFITYPDCKVVAMDANFKRLPFLQNVEGDGDHLFLGKSIQEFFPDKVFRRITDAIEEMKKTSLLREFVFASESDVCFSFCVSTNTIGEYGTIGIEIEPLDEVDLLDLSSPNKDLAKTLTSVGHALDFCVEGQEAAKLACNAIFKILGHFDRGMVYYFHDDLSGEVIYEIKKDTVESSYMGMHFPKADIPQSARLLYVKNVVRYIKNIDGEDVPIMGNAKVDLTQTRSRCVHKCHLIYMKGMGVKSALSLAIVCGGELWGLLSFHGYTTPFQPSIHQLIACETIASCVSARVVAHTKDVQDTRMLQMGQIARKWDTKASVTANLEAVGDQIVSFMEADVFALRYKARESIESVAKGDINLLPRGLFWTKMAQKVPDFELCVRSSRKSIKELGLTEKNCPGSDFIYTRGNDAEIMIGRSFRTRDVVWGGNPDAPKLNIGGLLHPRASFEAQVEKARKALHPFDTFDQKLATMLGSLVSRQASMYWVLALLDEEIDENVFTTFDALESTDDDQLLNLQQYLRTINLVKPRRLYLSSSKVKSMVVYSEFVEQSVASVRSLAEPMNLEVNLKVDESFSHLLVYHTELSQVVANMSKVGADFAGPMGSIDINFHMQDSLIDAIAKFEADAAKHHALAIFVEDNPVSNWMGSVKELAESMEESEDKKWFCFSVSDSGNGFELEQLEKMLQPHKQAHQDTNVTSTKLSLFLCVEFCRRLGGFMACASTPYEGTVFHVGIPVDVLTREAAEARLNEGPGQAGKPIIVSGPILIVGEDNAAVEKQLLSQCKRSGIKVAINKASNGQEAISAFSKEVTPSLMILDCDMSEMDGLEIVSMVRKIESERNLLPTYIVSYTKDVTNNATMILLKVGGNEVMVKPLPSDFIPNLVRRFKMVPATTAEEVMANIKSNA